ncbi:MAG TPA: lysine--tRNA ligase, partial [archaeon]|nr:lysine--tRNA ligase [archaeon]
YLNGNGKMSWKVEFAMRWSALQIVFEACGKDILDSVKVNDAISKEVLGFEPPLHIFYEMFLDKGGKKIAKSFGNVFTPQVWFNYGTPKSLILLMLKRFEGTRELDITDIPKYMDELDKLENVFFGLEEITDVRELTNSKRLFEYANFLKPPEKPSLNVAYNTMLEIARILPGEGQVEFVVKKLKDFGLIEKDSEEIRNAVRERLDFAKNWLKDFYKAEQEEVSISKEESKAIEELIASIKTEKDGEILQTRIFEIAKSNGIQPKEFFSLLYKIILKSERGPRLGAYILEVGKDEIIKKLKGSLSG